MEVSFNGKTISVSGISKEYSGIIEKRFIQKAPSSGIDKCFSESYNIVLKSRLGVSGGANVSKGVATKSLLNSINVSKQKISAKTINKRAILSMEHEALFNKYGFYVGAEKFKRPKNPSREAIERMTYWVRTKKGSFSFDVKATKKTSKEEKIARIILFGWANGNERKLVLPKWYRVLSDGGKDVTKALLKNKKCIQSKMKNILNNGRR